MYVYSYSNQMPKFVEILLPFPSRWTQRDPSKSWYLSATLDCSIAQELTEFAVTAEKPQFILILRSCYVPYENN